MPLSATGRTMCFEGFRGLGVTIPRPEPERTAVANGYLHGRKGVEFVV
jgi:hypothetical protein